MCCIDEENYSKIVEYLKLVLEENKNINLTKITDFKEAKLLHIDDSLTALKFINKEDFNNQSKQIIDLGSGCGFPGVALSVATCIPTILADSVKKKMIAVNKILIECNLQNQIKTVNSRIEELPSDIYFSDYVVSRAMASLPSVMELATPLLKTGGKLIVYKGNIHNKERENGLKIQDTLGLELQQEEKIKIDNDILRTLLVFKKINEPKIKLPRRNGKAQKNPLKK